MLPFPMVCYPRGSITVLHLGGGTLSAFILHIRDESFELIGTTSNDYFNGEAFDKVLIDYLVNEFKRSKDINLGEDGLAL